MTSYLTIKNWQTFQHYKDRNPPWIKLATDIFQNYEFACLQSASKLLAIAIWTLASRYNDVRKGLIPNDFAYIKRQCNLDDWVKEEHLKELINQGFLINADNPLSHCKQNACPETYSKYSKYSKEKESKSLSLENFENFWKIYGKHGNKLPAKKRFLKIMKEKDYEYSKIITGVERYKAYCTANDINGKFIKHASTWLNARGWEDDYPVSKKPAQQSRPQRAREAIDLGGQDVRQEKTIRTAIDVL